MRSLFLLLVLTSCARAQDDEIRSLTGKNLVGVLTQITSTDVLVTSKTGPVATPLAKVLAIQLGKKRSIDGVKHTRVTLLDGSVLHCQKVTLKGKSAELALISGLQATLPMNVITSILRDAENQGVQKKWNELVKQRTQTDFLVILRDGDLNPLAGLIGDADEAGQKISFKRDGAPDAIQASLDKVHGLIFFRTEDVAEPPFCKVYDKDGSLLLAAKISFEKDVLTLGTTFGAKLSLRREGLSLLDFNMGKLTYLSDLQPARIEEDFGLGALAKFQKDVNLFDVDPLQLEGVPNPKGLSIHGYTELEYDLGGQFKDLKGILRIDPRTGPDNQANVSIYCDGEKQFQELITIKANKSISINVKDVQRLKIVVAGANEANLFSSVTFAEARVSQ